MEPREVRHHIEHFTALALGHLDREYPNKLDHVINDAGEVRSPRELHPIFFGSFDWHSSVHAHWLLVRSLRLFPEPGRDARLRAILDERFVAEKVAGEVAYLCGRLRGGFERTYGWAWLLKLAAEIRTAAAEASLSAETRAACARWDRALSPLAAAFVERFLHYLPRATYPIRAGTHPNSAFGVALALDYARATGDSELDAALRSAARRWFLADAAYPAWEPGGADFLSPGLMEAECMRRVLSGAEFEAWFAAFLPRLAEGVPASLFTPAVVSDRSDGQIVHLDGLNLSRAWCWRSLARSLAPGDGRRAVALRAYESHLAASLPHIAGDYMGEHWLATFALLALTE